jgi:hypothetical protein
MHETHTSKPFAAIHGSLTIALTAVGFAAAVAACASSSNPPAATASSIAAQQLNYTVCMRANGVPNYPDPTSGSGIDALPLNSGINPQSPAFRATRQACAKLNPGNSFHLPAETASEKQAELKYAECMRIHAVPNYPDPAYDRNGRAIEKPLSTYGINADSPAVQRALKACADS